MTSPAPRPSILEIDPYVPGESRLPAGLKPIIGYLVALVIGLFVIAAVPWLSIGFLQ